MATKKNSKKTTSAARKRSETTEATTLAGVPDEISGVKTEHIKPELVRQALADVGLENSQPITELIPTLVGYYKGNYTEDELYECEVCGGPSVEADENCPFCGEEGIVEEEAEEPKLVKTEVNKAKKSTAKKPKKKTDTETVEATAEIVPVDQETIELRKKYSTKELDKKVAAINTSKGKFAEASYTLGMQIKELHDTDMWKVRSDEDGRPAYTNFKKFCDAELNMSHTWAYNLIEVATHFDKGAVKQLGTEKCNLLLAAPEDNREALLEEARNGLSKRELQRKVKEARAAADSGETTTASGSTAPRERHITAVSPPMKRKKFPAYKTKGVKKNDDPVRAVKVSDEPESIIEFKGAVLRIRTVESGKDGKIEHLVWFDKEE